MAIRYFGEHSITFVEYDESSAEIISRKNTWTDFHLVPTERPTIGVPSPKYTLVPIPGTNKIFDATDYMPGGLTFSRRTGQWAFNVDNEQWESWYDAKNALEKFINGKRLYCALADDPHTYYLGTFIASGWDDGEEYSQVTISYEIDYEAVDIDTSESDFAFVMRGYPIHKWFSDDRKNIGIKKYTGSHKFDSVDENWIVGIVGITDASQATAGLCYSEEEYNRYIQPYADDYLNYSIILYIYDDLNSDTLYAKFMPIIETPPYWDIAPYVDLHVGYNFINAHVAFHTMWNSKLIEGTPVYYFPFYFSDHEKVNEDISFHYRLFIVPWNGGG